MRLIAIGMTLLALFLAGCGSGGSRPTAPDPPPPSPDDAAKAAETLKKTPAKTGGLTD